MRSALAVTLISALLCGELRGDGFTLLSASIPPYSNSDSANRGLCIDITQALFEKAEWTLSTQFHPWARAQKMAIGGDSFLITPLTRTPEREPHYDWIVPLYRYDLQLISNDPTVPIEDPQAMREVEICVLRESPAEYKLIELGYERRLVVTEESKCLQLLALGRSTAVMVHGWLSATYGYRQFGGDPRSLLPGAVFASSEIYIGSSHGALSRAQRQRLERALVELKAEGRYQAIIEHYRRQLLAPLTAE